MITHEGVKCGGSSQTDKSVVKQGRSETQTQINSSCSPASLPLLIKRQLTPTSSAYQYLTQGCGWRWQPGGR